MVLKALTKRTFLNYVTTSSRCTAIIIDIIEAHETSWKLDSRPVTVSAYKQLAMSCRRFIFGSVLTIFLKRDTRASAEFE